MDLTSQPPSQSAASDRSTSTSRRSFLASTFGSAVAAFATLNTATSSTAAPQPRPNTSAGSTSDGFTQTLDIGAAKANVTPEKSMLMWGFAAREGPSKGTFLDIYVKAMTLNDGENSVVLLSGEFLFWPDDVIQDVRSRLRNAHGLEPDQILMNATHTHCGPSLGEEEYKQDVIEKTVGVVAECFEREKEGRLYFANGHADFSGSRRGKDAQGYAGWALDPYGPVDNEVTVLKAVDTSGDVIGITFTYACHPTTISDNLIGGDWAGYAMEFVEREFDDAVALFLQGAGGDQKPLNMREDDPYRFSYDGGPERCAHFGRKLASSVLKALSTDMKDISGAVRTQKETVGLPLIESRIDKEGKKPFNGPRRRWARMMQQMESAMDENGTYKKTEPCEVYTVAIGEEFTHVALNGEVCVPIGLRIKSQLVDRPVLVTAYTGPSIGYLAGDDQLVALGYEVRSGGPFSPEAEDYLLAKVMEMTGKLEDT